MGTENQSPSEERYNFFDAELLQIFSQREENVLISPISIKLVLGMLMEGAQGKTAEEIRTALRLPVGEEARRNEFNAWLSVLDKKKSPNVLKIANRLFLSDRLSVSHSYGRALRKYYSGGVTSVKFEEAGEASRAINDWVANQTSRLIPSIVEEGQLSPEDKLMLISAVYFKGVWSRPFASGRTAIRCFYTKDDSCRDSVMMTDTGYFDYGYIRKLDAKAIAIPFKGGEFSMLLLLPSKRDGIALLGRDMGHVSLASVLSELKEEEVFVQIPQFAITYNNDLVESLKSVQVSEVFSRGADFSKMFTTGPETAAVSHIYHSAKITVNEEGSEAAAATGAMFVPLMGGTTTSFVADHPFLFFVINSAKNLVLFAGKVVFPQTPAEQGKSFLPLTSHDEPTRRTGSPSKPTTSHQNGTARASASEVIPKPSEKNVREMKYDLRGRHQGPKFKSFKTPHSPSRSPSKEGDVGIDSRNAFESSLLPLRTRPDLISYPGEFFEKGIRKNNRKRQEVPSEDWRHRVLIFT